MRPWEYAYHPFRWDWSSELHDWSPKLKMFSLMAGAEGVRENLVGADVALGKLRARGFDIIEVSDKRLGEFQNYIIEHDVEGRIPQYVPVWVTPVVIGEKVLWDVDHEMHHAFLRKLIDSDIVGKPHRLVKMERIKRQRERIRRCENALRNNPTSALDASRLEMATRTLAEMEGRDPEGDIKSVKEYAAHIASQKAEQAIDAADAAKQRATT